MIGTPHILGAAAAAFFVGGGLGTWAGIRWEAGSRALKDQEIAKIVEKVADKNAEQIALIKPKNQTIVQKAETVVRETPVYRECRHDAAGLRLINEALTGHTSDTADQSKLPQTDGSDE